jgi:hypothetical protein
MNTMDFVIWLSEQPPNKFMQLFAGTRLAYEKEELTYQVVHAIASNYKQGLPPYMKLFVKAMSPVSDNKTGAYHWLIENKYLIVVEELTQKAIEPKTSEVDGEDFTEPFTRCFLVDISHLLLARLMVHFGSSLPLLPLSPPKNLAGGHDQPALPSETL